MREHVGPAKNPPLNDRETPSKTRRHNASMLGYFDSAAKGWLGGTWLVHMFFC